MPTRMPWEDGFALGHERIDAQHRRLLGLCNELAGHCAGSADDDRSFDAALDQLKALAREHFEVEAALLAGAAYPGLDEHRFECEEFEYLADEIATADNFDRLELQRFLSLWWYGHIRGSAPQRAYLAAGAASA